jgi:hypothetical protein
LKKRQEEVEELRRKQDEERKKREDFDRDGRQQVKFVFSVESIISKTV